MQLMSLCYLKLLLIGCCIYFQKSYTYTIIAKKMVLMGICSKMKLISHLQKVVIRLVVIKIAIKWISNY